MKKKQQNTAVNIILDEGQHVRFLDERWSKRSTGIREIIDRYMSLIALERRSLDLTVNEALFLVDSLNGTILDYVAVHGLPASVEDSCRMDHLHKKYDLDEKEFIEKINNMTTMQKLAIIDSVELFWNNPKEYSPDEESMRRIGLVK